VGEGLFDGGGTGILGGGVVFGKPVFLVAGVFAARGFGGVGRYRGV
jgi:hypothetical protein